MGMVEGQRGAPVHPEQSAGHLPWPRKGGLPDSLEFWTLQRLGSGTLGVLKTFSVTEEACTCKTEVRESELSVNQLIPLILTLESWGVFRGGQKQLGRVRGRVRNLLRKDGGGRQPSQYVKDFCTCVIISTSRFS